MTPNIESPNCDGERVVISGMSGLYAQSRSVKDLSDILYNKINPISNDGLRYNFKHPEAVKYAGNIPDLQRFDAQFFKIHFHLASGMDPMSRKILEQAYQAIYDAGLNPVCLSGKKVGVYVGSCYSETDKAFYYYKGRTSFAIAGCSKAKFANRISYWLDARGPSVAIDEACSSSTEALKQAYQAINSGECEAAVVAGSFLCLHPQPSVHYSRLLKLCEDGKTKAFSENADGCAMSEAINVLFLQKAKDAVRIYADVINVKCEYIGLPEGEAGPKFGFYREPRATIDFLRKFYEESKVPPQAVEYVEALGSAIPGIDKSELDTISDVFCNKRDDTLLVGSVMSNIGYTQAASGIAAVTKVLLAYHTGKIAANLHCDSPRQDVACLREGRVQIVTEHQGCRRGYVAVNGMSVNGVNTHVLLHGHYKPKDVSLYKSSIPYLVPISGRQESSVKSIVDNLKSRPIDPEELALLHNIHQYHISGHLSKGYVILDTDAEQKTVSLAEQSGKFDEVRRPLWFVYSGMGSQWPAMGAQLMRIPIFAAAIQRCHEILQPKGLNIIDIITLPDKKMFDNILHSFVGITAIQIGLTDISAGELGCSYADGSLDMEEVILSAYYRGLVSLQTPFIRGSMAAVGLGYSQIKEMCPPEIEVACHNGPDSCTLSGPSEATSNFVAELSAKGIFAKEVPSTNIAFHSRYIADAGPELLKCLKEVIRNPRPRSEKWISTSVPEDKWDEPLAKFSSAEYHTNNLLSTVFFEESSRLVPNNAVLVEVAPHGLLQAILKRSLSPDCVNIPITRRDHADNVLMLLDGIGKLYKQGYLVKIQNLYPKVQFPVSTGTPSLSHLVEWAYVEHWPIVVYDSGDKRSSSCCKCLISLFDTEHEYLRGNIIRGQTLYPFAAALVAVWDTLAMVTGVPKKQLSVKFRNIYLYSQPILHERRQLSLNIMVHRGTGNFQVLDDNDSKIATGFITPVEAIKTKIAKAQLQLNCDSDCDMLAGDIYQLFEHRGYNYSDKFRSIVTASSNLAQAELSRDNNWVTLIDGMLQLNTLRQQHSSVSVPTFIRSLSIDVKEHATFLDEKFLNIEYTEKHDVTRCGGVLIKTVQFRNLSSSLHHDTIIELIPNHNKTEKRGCQNLESKNVTLVSSKMGDYKSLQWVEAPELAAAKGLIVEVQYAGITNTDFKKASGVVALKSEYDNAYGMDFSGVVKSGERVMGIAPKGTCTKQIEAIPELLWPVPAHWTLEDAATVPSPYLHALYLLINKGRIEPYMNVLVHGGAGALGQAAIAVALAYNCTVFTTVSDVRKKRFLLQLFPELKAGNIGNSRDATFKDTVLTATKGYGCEIILSSIKRDLKQNNLQCCAYLGTIIDANQIQDHEHFNYGMAALAKERSYCLSDFSNVILNSDRKELKKLQLMLTEGIVRGYVRPLTRVTFAAHEVPRAFRLLAASAHRGRVILDLRSELRPNDYSITCNADRSQLIISNEDSLGLHLAERLIVRGAKRLHLNLKSGITGLIKLKMLSWKNHGVEVVVTARELDSVETLNIIVNNSMSLGQIEGIYVADIHEEEIISSIDKQSRKLCPFLRYFVVINSSGNVGQNVCAARRQCSLPSTMLFLPRPDEHIWTSGNKWYMFAVESIERALMSPGVAFKARPLKVPEKTLLQELAQVAGIKINAGINKEATLKALGLEDNKLRLISNFLVNNYNLYYDEEQLSEMTIEKFNAFGNVVKESEYDKLEGLTMFINYVNSDETMATTDIVSLPTLATSNMTQDDFDPTKKSLFIVPGLEGVHEPFRVLCERLKLPALVLQPGLDKHRQTLQDLATKYAEVILKKAGVNGYFYLMGYESGTAVALEVAGILEDHGISGTIFCLGCTANEFQETLQEELKKYERNDELQDAILYHMFKLMAGDDTTELDKALKNTTTWENKMEMCIRTLLETVSHSAQYTREVMETILARIVEVQKYRVPARRLRSKIVYLRAADYSDSDLAELQRHSEQPLDVYQLSAPLAHAALDLRCASIINDCLTQEILDEYDNGNTCESYLINSGSFKSCAEE